MYFYTLFNLSDNYSKISLSQEIMQDNIYGIIKYNPIYRFNFSHNDLPMNLRYVLKNHIADFEFDKDLTKIEPWASRKTCHTDLPRLREGKVGGVVSFTSYN